MAQCTTDGKPKFKYPTYMSAYRASKKQQKKTLALLSVYVCKDCGSWHFGKSNRSYEYEMKVKQRKIDEERLVGKLIGALRGTLTQDRKERI